MHRRAQLAQQFVLAGKHIDAAGHRREHRHHVGSHRLQITNDLRRSVHRHGVKVVHQLLVIVQHLHKALQINAPAVLDLPQQVLHIFDIAGQAGEQRDHAGRHLGQHQPDQQHQQQKEHRIGAQNGRPAQAGVVFQHGLGHPPHKGVQHIGQHNAARKGRQNGKHLAGPCGDAVQRAQHHVKQDAGADDDQPVPIRIRFFIQPGFSAHSNSSMRALPGALSALPGRGCFCSGGRAAVSALSFL